MKSLFKIYLLSLAFFSFQTQAQEDVPRPTQEALDIKNVFHPPSSTLEEASQAVWKLQSQATQGTGFFVAPKLLITNFHIILSSLASVDLKDIRLTHNIIPGVLKINRIKALSAELDLALLEIDSPDDYHLYIKEEPISETEDLFLLGYPRGSFHYITKTGHLKQNDLYSYFPVNYFNLAGASGGPILSTEGQVTGVASIATDNFLVSSTPPDILKAFMDGDTGIHCLSPDPQMCILLAIAVIYKKAKQGDALAQHYLSMIHLNSIGVKPNYEETIHWLKLAAEQNHLPAINNLALMYRFGRGIEQNYDQALYWFNLAKKQGFPPAIYNVATAYRDGRGVEQSDDMAFQLYQEAAEQNHLPAIDHLAVMYTHGRGVEQSDTKAFQLFKKAANQGFANAQYNSSLMYLKSRGVEQNYDQALYWLSLAAKQNHLLAIETLAWMYENGMIGTDQN